jgi:hypothetical protein
MVVQMMGHRVNGVHGGWGEQRKALAVLARITEIKNKKFGKQTVGK